MHCKGSFKAEYTYYLDMMKSKIVKIYCPSCRKMMKDKNKSDVYLNKRI